MDTTLCAKIIILALLIPIFLFTLDIQTVVKLINTFQAIFTALMILFLRTSLLSFYKMNNSTLAEFHPKYLNPQYDIPKFSFLNFKILFYSNISSLEKNYINLYENNTSMGEILKKIEMPAQEALDFDRKPYYLLATYNMKQCLDAAMWIFFFTVLGLCITFFL